MSQAILEIIFKTINNGQGGKQAASELKELKGTVGELTSGFTGLNLGSLTAAGAVVAVGGAVKAAADFAVEAVQNYQAYGEQIRTLSAITGTGAEQTSRLVQAFDDLGVTQEQFATLANGAAKKGFVMTIDNVAALADKYNALATQEEKNKLLEDKLGKSALETAKAFEKGGTAIRNAAASQEAGMIITERQAQDLERLRQQQDQLNDLQTAATNTLAQNLVPITLDYVSALEKVANGQVNIIQNGLLTIPLLANHEKKLREVGEAAIEAGKAAGTWANDVGTKIPIAADAAGKAIDPLKEKQDALTMSMKAYNTQTLYTIATKGLDADASLLVAEKLGLVDGKTAAAMSATEELRKKFDEGKITAGQYAAEVQGISNVLGGIQSRKVTIDVYIKTHESTDQVSMTNSQGQYIDPGTGSGYGGPVTDPNRFTQQDTNDRKASGGTYTVPPGYPNDSFTVGMTSGETYTVVNDRMRATGEGGGSGGGVQIMGDIYINNGMDLAAFEARLTQVMKLRG